jgi:hypothetical protein
MTFFETSQMPHGMVVAAAAAAAADGRWMVRGITRPRTYPFFEDIYSILYQGQKSDIISYPISRQKIKKDISYILSNFNLASKT